MDVYILCGALVAADSEALQPVGLDYSASIVRELASCSHLERICRARITAAA